MPRTEAAYTHDVAAEYADLRVTLEPLARVVRGRRVVLACPAPGVQLPPAAPDDVVYAVRGGFGCVTDRAVDLWQVARIPDRSHGKPGFTIGMGIFHEMWLDRVRHRHVPGVVLTGNCEATGALDALADRGFSADWMLSIGRDARVQLFAAAGVSDRSIALQASAGAIAIYLLWFVQAATIVACGFSWHKGYDYVPHDHPLIKRTTPRYAIADRYVLSALAAQQTHTRLETTSPALLECGFHWAGVAAHEDGQGNA